MIEVEIQGFQSIEKGRFRLDGFTAFVGKSNIGKSAVVRALRCALTGAVGTDFVRHGPACERRKRGNKRCKCQATVRVEMPELTFTWEKGDAINQYTVERKGIAKPEVYSKIDRGTPDFLLPYFNSIKVGKDQKLIQVSEQWDPIFLLNQGGNTVADVLSDVAQLDQINTAMGLVTKDRKNALATRTVRERDILDLEAALESYVGLDDAVARVRAVEEVCEAVEKAQETFQQLGGYLSTLRALAASIKALRAATAPELPDAAALTEKSQQASRLDGFYREVAERAKVVRRLRGIDKVAVPDAEPLEKTASKLDLVEGWLEQLRKIKVDLKQLKVLDELPEPQGQLLEEVRGRLSALQGFIDKRARLEKAQASLEVELVEVETEKQEVMQTFGELGVCPTCSQSIDADHCLRLGEE